jgi:DNA-nicking Smr family endonuclease
MTRKLRPEEVKLWSMVIDTVEPRPGRAAPKPPAEPPKPAAASGRPAPAKLAVASIPRPLQRARPEIGLAGIEPNRARRIALGREAFGGRLDLHGYGQDAAKATLERFVLRAHDDGARAVLVITGKGLGGDGILRRRVPEWLASPPLRSVVAGVSEAQARHGGHGALYVALKKRRD